LPFVLFDQNKAELFGLVDERLSSARMDGGERLYATVYASLPVPRVLDSSAVLACFYDTQNSAYFAVFT